MRMRLDSQSIHTLSLHMLYNLSLRGLKIAYTKLSLEMHLFCAVGVSNGERLTVIPNVVHSSSYWDMSTNACPQFNNWSVVQSLPCSDLLTCIAILSASTVITTSKQPQLLQCWDSRILVPRPVGIIARQGPSLPPRIPEQHHLGPHL